MQSSGNIGHERMLNNNNNSSSSSSNNNPKNMKSKKKIERKKKKLSKWFRMSRGNEPFVTSEHLQCRPKTETRHNTKEWRIIIIIMIITIIIMEAFSALWPFAAAVTSLSFFFCWVQLPLLIRRFVSIGNDTSVTSVTSVTRTSLQFPRSIPAVARRS